MKLIKDILNRKEIDSKAQFLVNSIFTENALKNISTNKKKSIVKLDQLLNHLTNNVTQYSKDYKLGIYGKARLLKSLQGELQQLDLDNDLVEYLINKLLYI